MNSTSKTKLTRVSKVFLFLIGTITASTFNATAQRSSAMLSYGGGGSDSKFGIEIGSGLDVPIGTLKDNYKSAPYFDGGFLYYLKDFTFGINAGYRSFPAKVGSYTETDDSGNSITTSVSKFSSIKLYASAVYNVNINDDLLVFGGFNIGSYISTYGYTASQAASGDNYYSSSHPTEEEGYIAPKIGLGIKLTDELQLNISANYNLFFTGSYSYNYSTDYGSSSTSATWYQSASAGASLTYRF